MWVMCDTGFISLVQHRDQTGDYILARSRVKEDLTAIFGPDTVIEDDESADYRFRTKVERYRVAAVISAKILSLDYTSHAKDVALKRSAKADGRTNAYYDAWTAFSQMQPTRPWSGKEPVPYYGSDAIDQEWWDHQNREYSSDKLPWWDDADMIVAPITKKRSVRRTKKVKAKA